MSTRRVTIASLSMTDGTTTRYAVYRATLHYNLARSEPYIDLNRGAQHVTIVTRDNRDKESNWHNDDLARRYLEMAEPFATPDAPAFAFTDCVFCYGTDPECRCTRRLNAPKTESSSSFAHRPFRVSLTSVEVPCGKRKGCLPAITLIYSRHF
jgi:hypothetical protein